MHTQVHTQDCRSGVGLNISVWLPLTGTTGSLSQLSVVGGGNPPGPAPTGIALLFASAEACCCTGIVIFLAGARGAAVWEVDVGDEIAAAGFFSVEKEEDEEEGISPSSRSSCLRPPLEVACQASKASERRTIL